MFVADVLAGVYAFGAIQAALLQRERSGRGQRIDVALMDSLMSMMVYECQEAQLHQPRKRHVYRPLRANDGYVIAAPLSRKNFENLGKLFRRSALDCGRTLCICGRARTKLGRDHGPY